MPGVVIVQDAEETPRWKDALPSKLIGPALDVKVTNALELFRSALDKYHDKLAVASLYQPANYLEQIFQPSGPQGLANGTPPDYLRWTFAQVRHAGELLAVSLAARGVREGMTIVAFVNGSVQIYMMLYASLILRCRFSPMNSAVTANTNEVQHMLEVVHADVVITTDEEILTRLNDKVPDLMRGLALRVVVDKPSSPNQLASLTTTFEYFEDLVVGALPIADDKSILERFEAIETGPEDNVVILFTSGTSSFPKPCPLTNRIMCSISTNFSNGPTGGTTAVVCNHLPIYHIAGIISAGWNPLTSGAAVAHPASHFTAKSTLDAMRLEGVTFMVLVPTMIGLLLNDPALPPPGELSIKALSLGASTILYTDVEKCYKYLGAKRVITSYGMTEGLMMTRGHLPREVTKEALDGIQQVSAGARIKICAANSRTIVPRGEPGEVHQGGATTIRGYLDKESSAFYEDEDGIWCITGDQAIMHPDGGVQITGRYKDLIIRGGVNVSPQAIEGVIAKILGLESHVVGMPDSIAGEVPVAIVRSADVGKASTAKLRGPIIKELGPRFALEKFLSLDELGLEDFPRTSTGKIRKIDLQALVKQYAQKQASAETVQVDQTDNSGKPTLARLIEIWSEVAGMDSDDLTPETSVHDLADSLMLARYAATVRQAFGRPFTLNDLEKFGTLAEQAKLVDKRLESDATNDDLLDEREGPPSSEDMAHTGVADEEGILRTRNLCEKVLHPMGFAWEDVQDVITPSEWLQSWVKSRATSDRFRAAYVSKRADIPTFQAALVETLFRNDSLRAVSVPCGDSTDVQAILRHSDKWLSKVVTVREEPVATTADLEKLIPGDFNLNHGLIKVIIAHVEETNSAGVCLMTLHTTFDAFSLDTMRKDLNLLLNEVEPKFHVPYKLWTDHLYNQRDSAQAKASIAYNVKRLKGLGAQRAALWPPQRAIVWQRGCDRGLHVTPEGEITSADDPKQRPLLDGAPEKCIGSGGIRREHLVQDMALLTGEHRIPPPVIVKAALVLLETRLTGQPNALFSQTFAMRDNWPFIDTWMSRRLPSPLEVTGPTLARIPEIITLDRAKNVMDWLHQLRSDQDVLINHAHAPYRHVFDQLNQNSEPTPTVNGHVNGVVNGDDVVEVNGDDVVEVNGITNGDPIVEAPPETNTSTTIKPEADAGAETNGDKKNDSTPEVAAEKVALTNGDTSLDTAGEKEAQANGILPEDVVAEKPAQTNGDVTVAASDEKVAQTNGDMAVAANAEKPAQTNGDVIVEANADKDAKTNGYVNGDSVAKHNPTVEPEVLPSTRDGDVMESIRKRINLQWLPIFKNDKKVESQVRIVSSSHFNEVGLAVKSGMLPDTQTIWIKMEWDDGNIRSSEAKAWIDEMIKYVELLGKAESWGKTVDELLLSANL